MHPLHGEFFGQFFLIWLIDDDVDGHRVRVVLDHPLYFGQDGLVLGLVYHHGYVTNERYKLV